MFGTAAILFFTEHSFSVARLALECVGILLGLRLDGWSFRPVMFSILTFVGCVFDPTGFWTGRVVPGSHRL